MSQSPKQGNDRLKWLMRHHSLTVQDVAALSELSELTVRKALRGKRIHVTSADAIADALDVRLDEIFDQLDHIEHGRPAKTQSQSYAREAGGAARPVCPICNLELLQNGSCGYCGED